MIMMVSFELTFTVNEFNKNYSAKTIQAMLSTG